jgi:predicted glutamine amidotransferase
MCIAIVCDSGKPTLEQLKNSEITNHDGGGIAWVEGGKVHWKKNISAQEIYQISQAKDLPQLIHFRLASVGGINPYLCHPFPVTITADPELEGEADAVLIHNGGYTNWNKMLMDLITIHKIVPRGPISDTRVMAMFAAHVGNTEVLQYFDEKIAVLKKDKTTEIYKIDSWILENGMYFSNSTYKNTYKTNNSFIEQQQYINYFYDRYGY